MLANRNGIALELTLQDVRMWGAEDDLGPTTLGVYAANLALPMTEQLKLVIGRQEFEIGHDRVLGTNDFQQSGRSFDGLMLTLTAPPAEAGLFYAKLRDDSPQWAPGRQQYGGAGDRDVGGVVNRTALVANHYASLLFLVDGNRATETTRYTFGGIIGGHQSVVHYWAEGYGQGGIQQHEPIRAYFLGTRAEITSQRRFAPHLALRLEHASGAGSLHRSFDVALGSSHEYFGALDLFVDLPKDTGFGGLTDFGASAGARPHPALRLTADWHYFSTSRTTGRASSGILGQEVDLSAVLDLADFAALEGLAAVFFPGDAFDEVRGENGSGDAPPELRGYLSLRARF